MRAALFCLTVVFCACHRAPDSGDARPAPEPAVTGSVSPSGDRHPGRIVQEDRVDGKTWTDGADAVPQSIAWAQQKGRWVPVVRIVVTGSARSREITRYGPTGEVLDRTMMTAPPEAP